MALLRAAQLGRQVRQRQLLPAHLAPVRAEEPRHARSLRLQARLRCEPAAALLPGTR